MEEDEEDEEESDVDSLSDLYPGQLEFFIMDVSY